MAADAIPRSGRALTANATVAFVLAAMITPWSTNSLAFMSVMNFVGYLVSAPLAPAGDTGRVLTLLGGFRPRSSYR